MLAKYKYHIWLHITIVIFGLTGVLGKLITTDSYLLVWYRVGIALVCILAYFAFTNFSLKVSKKELIKILLVGIVIAVHWVTFFEAINCAFFVAASKRQVDFNLIEVGLGGRSDSTAVINPEVSVISSISMDHQDFLGDTIDEIAHEKSGICRPNKPTVLNFENIPKSMIKELKKINATLSILNVDYSFRTASKSYNYKSNNISMDKLPVPYLKGNNQLVNLAGCLRTISLLQNKLPFSLAAVHEGIKCARIEGRLQVLSNNPYILADVAHNVDAAINLYNFFRTTKQSGNIYAVFSILESKDIQQVLLPFIDIVDEWFVSEIDDFGAQKIDVIISSLKKYNKKVTINKFDNINLAYKNAYKKCDLNDNIIIYGSFFTVSESMDGVKI